MLVLLAKICRELHLLCNNTVIFFPFVALGGVSVPKWTLCCLLQQLPPLAFSLCRLNSPVAVTPDMRCQLSPQSVA